MFVQILKKSFIRACVVYSILSVLYLVIMLDLYKTSANPYPQILLGLFPFCFLITFANTLVATSQNKGKWKLPVHFLLLTLDLILFIYLPAKNTLSGGSALILFVFYLILYVIGALLVRLFYSKNKQEKTEYQSVYRQKNEK